MGEYPGNLRALQLAREGRYKIVNSEIFLNEDIRVFYAIIHTVRSIWYIWTRVNAFLFIDIVFFSQSKHYQQVIFIFESLMYLTVVLICAVLFLSTNRIGHLLQFI